MVRLRLQPAKRLGTATWSSGSISQKSYGRRTARKWIRPKTALAAALDALPDLTRPQSGSESSVLAATGTDSATPDCHKLAAHWQRAGDESSRKQSIPDVMTGSTVPALMQPAPLKNRDS